jgi:hypothetical protein
MLGATVPTFGNCVVQLHFGNGLMFLLVKVTKVICFRMETESGKLIGLG